MVSSKSIHLTNGFSAEEKHKSDACYGARHTQIILLFLLVTLGYIMRAVMSVGIVAMTDPNASPNPDIPTYEWEDESIILTSFFFGYIIPQVGAGQLAKYYGPKYFLAVTISIGSLFNIAIPAMASLGSWAIILARVFQGIAQGFMYPSCHHLLSKWAPKDERSRFSAFVYSGGPFGTVIGLPLTGIISGSSWGWPCAFYLYGGLGLLWAAVWLILGKNSPRDHHSMSVLERDYIEESLNQEHDEEPIATPWTAIFCSLPFWSIFIGQCGQNWGFATLLTNIPTYLKNVLNFDIKSNGLLSAGPYLVFWLLSFFFSSMADCLITRKIASTTIARKVANSIGSFVPAAALIVLGIIGTTSTDPTTVAIILLFVAVGVNSATFSGYQVNHMDIAPNHSGTLMGLTNGISNITSIIGPLIIQYVVTEPNNPYQWANIFYISAAVYIAGNSFFIIFASGKIQPWNYAKDNLSKVPTVLAISEMYAEDHKTRF